MRESPETEKAVVKEKETPKPTTTMPATNQTHSQAATQTAEANTKASGVQCDLLKTSTPVVKNHHHGWLIPVSIYQVLTMALLDTGATCTMIGQPLYETLQAAQPLKVKQDKDLRLEVGGDAAPTLGTATI